VRTLVVPLDGSTLADNALRPAYAAAARGGARVVLLTAHHGSGPDADDLLAGLRRRAEVFGRVAPTEVAVRSGDAATVIAGVVEDADDPVVCMATHGRTGLATVLLGSVATAVLRTCAAPVLAVGPRCSSAILPAERATMIVGTDGTTEGDAIAPVAARWAEQLDLDLCVAETTYPEEAVSEDGPPTDTTGAATRSDLDRLAHDLSHRCGKPVHEEVLYGTEPGKSIADFAARSLAAFVTMSGRGRGGLAAAVLGSVAMDTVRLSPCPVLLVRTDEAG
jgi:nucleotide-binding universal stress UspA family protein